MYIYIYMHTYTQDSGALVQNHMVNHKTMVICFDAPIAGARNSVWRDNTSPSSPRRSAHHSRRENGTCDQMQRPRDYSLGVYVCVCVCMCTWVSRDRYSRISSLSHIFFSLTMLMGIPAIVPALLFENVNVPRNDLVPILSPPQALYVHKLCRI
jgi:hypothetical protein